MSNNDFKNTPYWNIYAEVVAIHRKYSPVTRAEAENEQRWIDYCSEGNSLSMKYADSPASGFVNDILEAMFKDIERQCERLTQP